MPRKNVSAKRKADRERAAARRAAARNQGQPAGPDEAATIAAQSELQRLAALDPHTMLTFEGAEPVGMNADGLKFVGLLATAFPGDRGLKFIAKSFNIHRSVLKALFDRDKGANAIRLAWEAGDAMAEFAHYRLMMGHAADKFIAAIFVSKSIHNWRENDQSMVTVNANGPTLVLPDALSEEELYRRLGISGPVHLVAQPAPLKLIEPPEKLHKLPTI
jgi:hypothetical protein